jgi:glutamyl-tRNA synthetase
VCDQLISEGKAYRCFCTKEELAEKREAHNALHPKDPFVYPGTCRNRSDQPEGVPYVVRFKAPSEGATVFHDKVFGTISTPNTQQYDFVLLRGDGFPLYNLACVIDDHDMQINLVARGRDHIGNTPQQVLLYQALGWELPEFAHLPMMLNEKGAKLSKRHADVAVQDYQKRGYTADGVLNYLVRFGWSYGDQEIFTKQQLIELFSWDRVGKSDGKYDVKKFADVAFEHLKEPELLSLDEYAKLVVPFLEGRGLEVADFERVKAALSHVRLRAKSLEDAAFGLDYFFRDPPQFDEKARTKFLGKAAAEVLAGFAELVREAPDFRPAPLEERFLAWVEERGYKMKDVAQPARVALTGRAASPGLFEVMEILGRELSVKRLERGVELANSAP